jgi:hypothetical protein
MNPKRLLGLLLALLALGFAGACGKKEAPLAPEAVLPGTVKNFALTQDGESLVARWDFPRENQLGQPLTQLEGFQPVSPRRPRRNARRRLRP